MPNSNYYKILEISPDATPEEIKKAYRRLILTHHPDKGGSAEKFREIQEAYETLINQNYQRQFDNNASSSKSERDFPETNFNEVSNLIKCKVSAINIIKEKISYYKFNHFSIIEMDLNGLCHQFCSRKCLSYEYIEHVNICLNNCEKVNKFKKKFLGIIENYANELKELKEKAINEIENNLANNQTNLDDDIKKLFEKDQWKWKFNEMKDWKEHIWICNNKNSLKCKTGYFNDFISTEARKNINNKTKHEEDNNLFLSQLNQGLPECQEQQQSRPDEVLDCPENNQEENSFLNNKNQNFSDQTPKQQTENKRKKEKNRDKNNKRKESQPTTEIPIETPLKSQSNEFPIKLIVKNGVLVAFLILAISMTLLKTKGKLLGRK